MSKRYILPAILASLLAIIGAGYVFFFSRTPLNTRRAEILARRVLLDPTPEDVDRIAKLGSTQAAIEMLFSPPDPAEEQKYQAGLAKISQTPVNPKNETLEADTVYAYEMIHDPDRARRKLYYLWENIFSVDAPEKGKQIDIKDVTDLHKILYDNAYGNYITLVDKVMNDYAMARYLDLAESRKNNPNENFARELMQLFMIGVYRPTDHGQNSINYTDSDVNALSYLLTGYKADKVNHTLSYDPTNHYEGQKEFLGESVNKTPDEMINFIAEKKKTEAGEFLADKLLRYYITDSPTDEEIQAFSNEIINNNFDILPSVKWLLTADFANTDAAISEERYKTPPELYTSFYTGVFGRGNYNIVPTPAVLTDLGFTPYRPGSIFGREGFNHNLLFYSGSIINRWLADSYRLTHERGITIANRGIADWENLLFLSGRVPDETAKILGTTKGADLVSGLLAQPEFLLNTLGTPGTAALPDASANGGDANLPKLIVVRLRGGYDFQQLVANTADPAYKANRGIFALNNMNSTSLAGGYVINNAGKMLLPLLETGQAALVASVGLPNHARAHDIAGIQMETGLLPNQEGILSKLSESQKGLNLISLTNTPPVMLKGATSLQIGAGILSLPVQEVSLFKNILSKRVFPEKIAPYYSQAMLISDLAQGNIKAGGKGIAGATNKTQLPFLSELISRNIGNVYFMYGDGGFDNHAHEDKVFDPLTTNLFTNLVNFYNSEKDKTKLAIVIFTEFGRTNKVNSADGTDHGEGGGMIVISNTLNWPVLTGTMAPSQDKNNWLTVQVDERDVWSTLFHDLYQMPLTGVFSQGKSLSNYPITISKLTSHTGAVSSGSALPDTIDLEGDFF